MKELSAKDKKILSKHYSEKEIEFMELHLDEVSFTHQSRNDKISAEKARKLLGDELFLSGLASGVFTRFAVRKKDKNYVGFYRPKKDKS